MPNIKFHKKGQIYEGSVESNTNLVVRAGIKQFPYPNLAYKCGMGTCATCACKVLSGEQYLPPPNWKEKKQLGDKVEDGYRLVCQLWVTHDLELAQDVDPVNAV
jgi:ferredoxin